MYQNLHLKIKKTDMADFVLLFSGDPDGFSEAGKRLKSAKEVFRGREYQIIKGTYQNIPVLAVTTGMGGPSVAIAMEELIRLGAKVFIRIGTCGGAWTKSIKQGSLIIPTACVREDGASLEYVNCSFPAAADFNVVSALVQSAKLQQANYFLGINRSHDAFYGNINGKLKWRESFQNLKLKDSPIISSDMETSIIYVLAALRQVKAGAILSVNAKSEPLLAGLVKDPVVALSERLTKKTIKQAIQIALNSLIILKKTV